MVNRGEGVLITGGSGFIGSFLARDLIGAGLEVHLILRRQSNYLWRLAGLDGQFSSHWCDLRDRQALREAVNVCRPCVIYHLATHGAYHFQKNSESILATNVLGTANLLAALADHP